MLNAALLASRMIPDTNAVIITARATINKPMSEYNIVSLAFLSLPGSPEDVIYWTPPKTRNTAEIMPAMAVTQLIRLVTMSPGVVQALSTQSPMLPLLIRAMRMDPMMILADMTMARPIKAWARVFLPVATLLGSPPEKVY